MAFSKSSPLFGKTLSHFEKLLFFHNERFSGSAFFFQIRFPVLEITGLERADHGLSKNFGALLEECDKLGMDAIATGHYARIEKDSSGRFLLKKATDISKDQSYVLYSLSQHQLSRTLLPLGSITKDQAREIAHQNGFINAQKRDSQDICFIPDGDYAAFIERITGEKFPKGSFIDSNGAILGEHDGIIKYTVGQRKGIGAYGKPMFVKRIDPENNRLILGAAGEEYESTLEADGLIFSGAEPFEGTIECEVKHRYRAPAVPCTVTVKDGIASAKLHTPARAITPGQSAVFYKDGRILFGGFIR